MTKNAATISVLALGLLIGMPGHPQAQVVGITAEQLAEQLAGRGNGKVELVYHPRTGALKFLSVDAPAPLPTRPASAQPESGPVNYETAARRFLESYGLLFGIRDQNTELAGQGVTLNGHGHFFVRFQQQHRGIRIFGGQLIVQLNPEGDLLGAVSRLMPAVDEETGPEISAQAARESALQAAAKWHAASPERLRSTEPELWLFNPALFDFNANHNSLVWQVEVTSEATPQIDELMLVRARDGKIILHFNRTKEALNRKIYDNQNNVSAGKPGWGPVRVEGQSRVDIADVDNTYDYMGDWYAFFQTVFGRDSVDGKGFGLSATVRYCEPEYSCPYINAFWSSQYKQLFLGSRGLTDDTVAHELGHGFSSFSSSFYYFMQSGAIEESMADVWGEFVDQVNGRGNDSPSVRWLLFEDDPEAGATRSMSNPNQFGHPETTFDSKYYCGTKDHGGVHSNSGVGNKTAYLITDGGNFNGIAIRGLGMAKTAHLYYEYQEHLAVSGADYEDLHFGLRQACRNLIGNYGITADDCEQVRLAGTATGMTRRENWCVYPKAPVCSSGTAGNIFFDDIEGDENWEKVLLSGEPPAWQYIYDQSYASSGKRSLYVENVKKKSDLAAAMKRSVALPRGQRIFMHFMHSYQFESESGTMYDGGVLEYSLDEGRSWQDTQSLYLENGYDGTINTGAGNPLSGRRAFTGTSFGYTSSRLDLSSLAGGNVRFRFRTGNDQADGDEGWYIDDIRIYTCESSYLAGTPRGSIDRPANNEAVSGNINVSGWAAVVSGSTAGPPKRIDLYVDEALVRQLTGRTARPDVQQYFAGQGITAPDNLGFSGAWDSRSVSDGPHQLSVRAADTNASSLEIVSEIARISVRANNGVAPSTTVTVTTTSSTRPPGSSTTTSTTTAATTTTLPSAAAEPATSLFLTTRSGEACPGFYIGDVALASGARSGIWGIEILLTAGQRLLQGGLNLGGGFEENGKNNAWGAFTIANPNNEPQEVAVRVEAQALPTPGFVAAALGLNVLIVDANRNPVGVATVGPPPLQFRKVLNPGFYIIEVRSLPGSPKGTFQLSAETGFVGRPGGGFQGGVVVGGHLTRDASGNSIHGFAAFCIDSPQNVSFKTYGTPSYGSTGAGNLLLAVKDGSQRIIWQSPGP